MRRTLAMQPDQRRHPPPQRGFTAAPFNAAAAMCVPCLRQCQGLACSLSPGLCTSPQVPGALHMLLPGTIVAVH